MGAGGASALMLSFNGLANAATRKVSSTNMLAIYDATLDDGHAFARASASAGHSPVPISGDFATMLYGVFPLEAADAPTRLLGLTSYAGYLVASGIGQERGAQLAGALLRENGAVRMIGGTASQLAQHIHAAGCDSFAASHRSAQTSVFWVLI